MTNQVRIIAGHWRRQLLRFPDRLGLRPTGDRARETLFNWLQWQIPGAYCLDAFAGSGALGIECLSRDAAFVDFCETDPLTFSFLQQNTKNWPANNYALHQQSFFHFQKNKTEVYDIIFLDPPFAENLWTAACNAAYSLLKINGLLYVESTQFLENLDVKQWQPIKQKRLGQVYLQLLNKKQGETI